MHACLNWGGFFISLCVVVKCLNTCGVMVMLNFLGYLSFAIRAFFLTIFSRQLTVIWHLLCVVKIYLSGWLMIPCRFRNLFNVEADFSDILIDLVLFPLPVSFTLALNASRTFTNITVVLILYTSIVMQFCLRWSRSTWHSGNHSEGKQVVTENQAIVLYQGSSDNTYFRRACSDGSQRIPLVS